MNQGAKSKGFPPFLNRNGFIKQCHGVGKCKLSELVDLYNSERNPEMRIIGLMYNSGLATN